MQNRLQEFPALKKALEQDRLTYLFGAGISVALTDVPYSWEQWLRDGIQLLPDRELADQLSGILRPTTDSMIQVADDLITATKAAGVYHQWMKNAFERHPIQNPALAQSIAKLPLLRDIIATTNYDLLLEEAANLPSVSYDQPDRIFQMRERLCPPHVVHLHGLYSSADGIDNIIAGKSQYDSIYHDDAAQFIQNLLGTSSILFLGCGQTTQDPNLSRFLQFASRFLHLDVPYFYFMKKGDAVPVLPDNTEVVVYGDEYSDLTGFLEEMLRYRLDYFLRGHPLVGYLPGCGHDRAETGLSKYHFLNQNIPFVGRREELQRLERFMAAESPCSWWAVTGQAGSGKSRLTLEWMERQRNKWFCFFLREHAQPKDAENFAPFCDTLVAIDYVQGREDQAAQILQTLIRTFQVSPFRLRVLLLERSNDTGAGTWFFNLERALDRYDKGLLSRLEYREDKTTDHSFLELWDLDDAAVLQLIASIFRKHKLPADPDRDEKLRDQYGAKFENLHFRPLFVQLFVESWIEQGGNALRYDSLEGVLDQLLEKEEQRWLDSVGGDHQVCACLIRLLVRSCAGGGLALDQLPPAYQGDWDQLRAYHQAHTLPGAKRKQALQNLLGDAAQSLETEPYLLIPRYPDIVQEYMFFRYTDEADWAETAQELWSNAGQNFSAFLYRCLTDFPNHPFFHWIIDHAPNATKDSNVLLARLARLEFHLVQSKEDVPMFRQRVAQEHAFWLSVEPEGDGQDGPLSLLKFRGLSLTAIHLGAWIDRDAGEMMDCIRQTMDIPGGELLQSMKALFLWESIQKLIAAGFWEEASELQRLLKTISESPECGEERGLFQLCAMHCSMMEALFDENLAGAYKILRTMEQKLDRSDLSQVQCYAKSCWVLAHFGFELESISFIDRALFKLKPIYQQYSGDQKVRAAYLSSNVEKLQACHVYGKPGAATAREMSSLREMLQENLSISEIHCEELADSWSMFWVFNIRTITTPDQRPQMDQLIQDAEQLLSRFPKGSSIAQAYMRFLQHLHVNLLHDKISRAEVRKAYAYLLRMPDSPSLRSAFWEMLEDSVERDYEDEYVTADLLREEITEARFGMW